MLILRQALKLVVLIDHTPFQSCRSKAWYLAMAQTKRMFHYLNQRVLSEEGWAGDLLRVCMWDIKNRYISLRQGEPNPITLQKKRRKCGHLLRPKYYPLHATIKQKGQSRGPAEEASETHCFEPLSYFLPFILADLCNLILAERG